MGKSLYKDMLSMFTKASAIKPVGNHLRRLNALSGMICSCMKTKIRRVPPAPVQGRKLP